VAGGSINGQELIAVQQRPAQRAQAVGFAQARGAVALPRRRRALQDQLVNVRRIGIMSPRRGQGARTFSKLSNPLTPPITPCIFPSDRNAHASPGIRMQAGYGVIAVTKLHRQIRTWLDRDFRAGRRTKAQRTRTLALELLEERTVPSTYNLAPTVDGFANDHNLDGTFETLNTSQDTVQMRLFQPIYNVGEDRGLFEFNLGSLLPGWTINSAAMRFTVASYSGQGVANVDLFGYTGDGPRISNLRGPSGKNLDFSITKNTRIGERANFQLRFAFFNAFNQHYFYPAANVNNQGSSFAFVNDIAAGGTNGFGTWNRGVSSPRTIQIGARIEF